jgi:hypothetical protein
MQLLEELHGRGRQRAAVLQKAGADPHVVTARTQFLEELEKISKMYEERFGRALNTQILSELSGDDDFDAESLMLGPAVTLQDEKELVVRRKVHEDKGLYDDIFNSVAEQNMDADFNEFMGHYSEVSGGYSSIADRILLSDDPTAVALADAFYGSADNYRATKNTVADMASTTVTTVGVVTAATILAIPSGGGSYVAVAIVLGAGGLGMGTKALFKGAGYGWEEAGFDGSMIAADLVLLPIGGAAGAKVGQKSTILLGELALRGTGKEITKELALETGEQLLKRSLLLRMTVGGAEGTADGFVSSLGMSAFQLGANPESWDMSLEDMLQQAGYQVFIGTSAGGVMGSLMRVRNPKEPKVKTDAPKADTPSSASGETASPHSEGTTPHGAEGPPVVTDALHVDAPADVPTEVLTAPEAATPKTKSPQVDTTSAPEVEAPTTTLEATPVADAPKAPEVGEPKVEATAVRTSSGAEGEVPKIDATPPAEKAPANTQPEPSSLQGVEASSTVLDAPLVDAPSDVPTEVVTAPEVVVQKAKSPQGDAPSVPDAEAPTTTLEAKPVADAPKAPEVEAPKGSDMEVKAPEVGLPKGDATPAGEAPAVSSEPAPVEVKATETVSTPDSKTHSDPVVEAPKIESTSVEVDVPETSTIVQASQPASDAPSSVVEPKPEAPARVVGEAEVPKVETPKVEAQAGDVTPVTDAQSSSLIDGAAPKSEASVSEAVPEVKVAADATPVGDAPSAPESRVPEIEPTVLDTPKADAIGESQLRIQEIDHTLSKSADLSSEKVDLLLEERLEVKRFLDDVQAARAARGESMPEPPKFDPAARSENPNAAEAKADTPATDDAHLESGSPESDSSPSRYDDGESSLESHNTDEDWGLDTESWKKGADGDESWSDPDAWKNGAEGDENWLDTDAWKKEYTDPDNLFDSFDEPGPGKANGSDGGADSYSGSGADEPGFSPDSGRDSGGGTAVATKPKTKTATEVKPEAQTARPEVKPETKTAKPEAKPETKIEKPEAKPETKAAKPEVKPEATPKPEAKPETVAKPEIPAKPDAQLKPDAPEVKPKVEPAPAQVKPDAEAPTTLSKPKGKEAPVEAAPAKTEAAPETKTPQAKPDEAPAKIAKPLETEVPAAKPAEPEVQPQTKPTPKEEVVPDRKMKPETETAQPQKKPAPIEEPTPTRKAKPASEPDPKTTQPAPKVEPKPEAAPSPMAKAEPQVRIRPKLRPLARPMEMHQPKPVPEPQPFPKPEPAMFRNRVATRARVRTRTRVRPRWDMSNGKGVTSEHELNPTEAMMEDWRMRMTIYDGPPVDQGRRVWRKRFKFSFEEEESYEAGLKGFWKNDDA